MCHTFFTLENESVFNNKNAALNGYAAFFYISDTQVV